MNSRSRWFDCREDLIIIPNSRNEAGSMGEMVRLLVQPFSTSSDSMLTPRPYSTIFITA